MKICVTGSSGFIGNHLVKSLLEQGHEIHALVRSHSDISSFKDCSEISFYYDLKNAAEITSLFRSVNIEAVFHLASLFIAEHKAEQIAELIDSNVRYGTELLQATADAGVSIFINTGTTWQHYQQKDYLPVCLYAATKQAFEDILKFYADAYPLRTATLELCDTYGSGDKRKKILAILIEAALSGERLGLSPGEQKIDLVHVIDIVSAFNATLDFLMKADTHTNQKFQVSSMRPISIRELKEEVANATGRLINAEWGGRPYRAREVMTPWTDLKPPPGWKAKVPLSMGIREIAFKA